MAFRDNLFFSILMDSECETGMCIQRSTPIEEWGIEVDLDAPYTLSSGVSTITFDLQGKRDTSEADLLLSSFCFSLSIVMRQYLILYTAASALVLETEINGYR